MNTNSLIGGVKKVSRKSFGLDAVRAFAIFSVIGGHFFVLYTPFWTTPVSDVSLILQSVANSILGCGVPLFIMLTGYLNVNKTICRTYYSKIWRVLFAYVLFLWGLCSSGIWYLTNPSPPSWPSERHSTFLRFVMPGI